MKYYRKDYPREKLLLYALSRASLGGMASKLANLQNELITTRPRLPMITRTIYEDKITKDGEWYQIPRQEDVCWAQFGVDVVEHKCYDLGVEIKALKGDIIAKMLEQANHNKPNEVKKHWSKCMGEPK